MAKINEYFKNITKNQKDIRDEIRELYVKQSINETDIEANAEAIEELAELIAGGE